MCKSKRKEKKKLSFLKDVTRNNIIYRKFHSEPNPVGPESGEVKYSHDLSGIYMLIICEEDSASIICIKSK